MIINGGSAYDATFVQDHLLNHVTHQFKTVMGKERTTYNFIRVNDRLQTMRNRDQSNVALELVTKGRLNDGICLVVCNSPISQGKKGGSREGYYQ